MPVMPFIDSTIELLRDLRTLFLEERSVLPFDGRLRALLELLPGVVTEDTLGKGGSERRYLYRRFVTITGSHPSLGSNW